ncbi:MAG: hypothetical protein AABX01_00420 [Candidatus Micrarchaeota archaeon]
MGLDDVANSLPQALSFAAVFISVILMFYGLRYFYTTRLEDIGRLLAYSIPSLWMMMLAIYLWLMGKERGE